MKKDRKDRTDNNTRGNRRKRDKQQHCETYEHFFGGLPEAKLIITRRQKTAR